MLMFHALTTDLDLQPAVHHNKFINNFTFSIQMSNGSKTHSLSPQIL